MAGSFVVLGLGQFGRHLAVTLSRAGAMVVALDSDPERVEEIKELVARCARGNCTDEAVLRAARVAEADCAILALGEEDFEATTLAVAALASLGLKRIVARATSSTRGRILQLVGAHSVVFPELQAAEHLAHSLLSGLDAALALPSGYTLAQVTVPRTYVGLTLNQAVTRHRLRANIIAVRREVERAGQNVDRTLDPEPELKLEEGDTLVVAGRTEAVDALGKDVD